MLIQQLRRLEPYSARSAWRIDWWRRPMRPSSASHSDGRDALTVLGRYLVEQFHDQATYPCGRFRCVRSPYAHRLPRCLTRVRTSGCRGTSRVLETGSNGLPDETGHDPRDWGFPVWGPMDMAAPFASGSAKYQDGDYSLFSGLLGRVAHGTSMNLYPVQPRSC